MQDSLTKSSLSDGMPEPPPFGSSVTNNTPVVNGSTKIALQYQWPNFGAEFFVAARWRIVTGGDQ
jgi:hypothetical protein